MLNGFVSKLDEVEAWKTHLQMSAHDQRYRSEEISPSVKTFGIKVDIFHGIYIFMIEYIFIL